MSSNILGSKPSKEEVPFWKAESPVIEGHFSNTILYVDQLAANIEQLLSPVVLHRVHAGFCRISALMCLGADALMNAQCVPWEVVHHPEVLPLVNNL